MGYAAALGLDPGDRVLVRPLSAGEMDQQLQAHSIGTKYALRGNEKLMRYYRRHLMPYEVLVGGAVCLVEVTTFGNIEDECAPFKVLLDGDKSESEGYWLTRAHLTIQSNVGSKQLIDVGGF